MATWNGSPGDDLYEGTEFDDYINGLLGNDTLYGMGGNDTISGSWGNDALYGGDGDDIFDGGAGTDFIDGGAGNDTMWMYYAGASVTADLRTGFVSGGETTGDAFTSIENLTGAYDYANALTGDFRANTLIGGLEGDVLSGQGGNDKLYGWRGADTLMGGNGDDLLSDDRQDMSRGTEGDILNGGAGADSMWGGLGDDVYYVDNAGDTVHEYYNEGYDTVIATASHTLADNVEKLSLAVAGGNIDGTGNGEANLLLGNASANTLNGMAGNDTLRGNGGADILIGGLGQDILAGGAGEDTFKFNSTGETPFGTGRDTIRDFTQGADLIDLSGIDAIAGGTDDAFLTLRPLGASFTGAAGQLRFFHGADGNTYLAGDINGDRAADFQIKMTGLVNLDLADFIL